ncbi:hypothetical protein WJX84_011377 [Apatococcus fuscideae]|uniref:Uncharacterized protein n=1 Tax=Apatococcus fuscideae TaxID=2026836 RepID=A0AAW1TM35_9CHLO
MAGHGCKASPVSSVASAGVVLRGHFSSFCICPAVGDGGGARHGTLGPGLRQHAAHVRPQEPQALDRGCQQLGMQAAAILPQIWPPSWLPKGAGLARSESGSRPHGHTSDPHAPSAAE